jgi:hypothetical protein
MRNTWNVFETSCSRRMEKISWTDYVRKDEVLQGDKEDRNIVHTTERKNVNWIGKILREK